eukprot:TRINITY_DN7671_c0_g1_i2.p1 TRINITY_DN7671_c0_g1~~TRINITY_DN7671_c0_g1_i2.p1  ORF type:complete len:422 (-),score=179.20 TRINITY_DN7671_c0_g1_i2:24-1289(-)
MQTLSPRSPINDYEESHSPTNSNTNSNTNNQSHSINETINSDSKIYSNSPSSDHLLSPGQGEKDNRNPGNNLCVRGLALSTTEDSLRELFSKFGQVVQCHLVRDPRSGSSRGFAFVSMQAIEDAETVIEKLNQKTFEGRTVVVEKAKRSCPRSPTPGQYLGKDKRDRRGRSYHNNHNNHNNYNNHNNNSSTNSSTSRYKDDDSTYYTTATRYTSDYRNDYRSNDYRNDYRSGDYRGDYRSGDYRSNDYRSDYRSGDYRSDPRNYYRTDYVRDDRYAYRDYRADYYRDYRSDPAYYNVRDPRGYYDAPSRDYYYGTSSTRDPHFSNFYNAPVVSSLPQGSYNRSSSRKSRSRSRSPSTTFRDDYRERERNSRVSEREYFRPTDDDYRRHPSPKKSPTHIAKSSSSPSHHYRTTTTTTTTRSP